MLRVCVDIFSLVSDANGHLVRSRFNSFLQELLTLPAAVYEGPSFEFNETSLQSCFATVSYQSEF
jgi:hypothetical protein